MSHGRVLSRKAVYDFYFYNMFFTWGIDCMRAKREEHEVAFYFINGENEA